MIISGAGLLLFTCAIQFLLFKSPVDYVATYDFPLYLPLGMCVFELLRRFGGKIKETSKYIPINIFTYISKIAFGCYFVHVCIMTFIEKFFVFSNWSKPVLCLFFEVVSVALSIGVIWTLSHSKVLKRYLFLIKDNVD